MCKHPKTSAGAIDMNERIKQFAWQVGITIVEQPFDDATQSWNDSMEKFAELIVLETLDQVNKNMELTWPEGEEKIKQHFGVEL
jgi:hypothetical protein